MGLWFFFTFNVLPCHILTTQVSVVGKARLFEIAPETIYYRLPISCVRVELGGVAWEAASVIPRHLVLSYEALCIASTDFPVQRVILSSHLVFGLPLLRPPSTVPCILVVASASERLIWPYQAIFCRFTMAKRCSCVPITVVISSRTDWLVLCSL